MILFVERIYLYRIHQLFLNVDSNRTCICPFLRELDVLFKIYLVTKTSYFVQDISGYVRSTISKSEHKISKRDRNNILVRGMTSFSKLQFISCCNSCSPLFREIVQNNTVNIHCDCSSCEITFFVVAKKRRQKSCNGSSV